MDSSGLLIIGVGVLVFIAVFSAGYLFLGGRRNLEQRIRQQGVEADKKAFEWRSYLNIPWAVLKPLGEMMPRSPEEMSQKERRLVQAGIRRRDGPLLFYGAQLILFLAFVTTFFVTGLLKTNWLLYPVLSFFLGRLLPNIWLNKKIAARRDRIQLGLPDALDLMVLCVEAGLGLDQALTRIGQEIRGGYPDLSDEFQLYGLEVTAGKKRDEALRNLGQRSATDDLKAFANALIQANRFGVAIAHSLRVFSESMRVKRRQRLEERAAKMSTKMVPALVFFILPAVFVVEIGPALIRIAKNLLPTLSK